MDHHTLGRVGIVSIIWSVLVATIMHLTGTNPFEETGLLWFAGVLAPILIVGTLAWSHRIRLLIYALILSWLIQLVLGNRDFVFYVTVGYPIALFYEIMARRYAKHLNGKDC